MDVLAAQPVGNTPAELAAFVRAEQKKWGDLIREVGIKAEHSPRDSRELPACH